MPDSQYPQYQSRDSHNMQDVDHLVLKVLEVQEIRQKMHQVQEELNWDRQNIEDMQGERHRTTQPQGRHRDLPYLPVLYLFKFKYVLF